MLNVYILTSQWFNFKKMFIGNSTLDLKLSWLYNVYITYTHQHMFWEFCLTVFLEKKRGE